MSTLRLPQLFVGAFVLSVPFMGTVQTQAPTEALTTDMDAKTDDLFNGFGARGSSCDPGLRPG